MSLMVGDSGWARGQTARLGWLLVLALATTIQAADWSTGWGTPAFERVRPAPASGTWSVRWNVGVAGPIDAPPVADAARVYIVDRRAGVTALNLADGTVAWRFTPPALPARPNSTFVPKRSLDASPVLVGDSLVLADDEGNFFALQAGSGRLLWTRRTELDIVAALNHAVLPDGRNAILAVASAKGVIHCLDAADGSTIWTGQEIGRSDAPPVVAADRIVLGGCNAALNIFALQNGKLLSTIELGEGCELAAGAAVADGHIVAGTRSGELVCADMVSGDLRWRKPNPEGEAFAVPAVGKEDVVCSIDGGAVRSVARTTGKLLWDTPVDGRPSSPVILGPFVLFTLDGNLRAHRRSDGRIVWQTGVADDATAPILAEHVVIVCGDDGTVIAAELK